MGLERREVLMRKLRENGIEIFAGVLILGFVWVLLMPCGCGSSNSRKYAIRMMNMNNMKQILQMMHAYGMDHDDQCPENLTILFEGGYVFSEDPVYCFAEEDKIELPGDFEKLSEAEKQGWFDKSSYEFVWPRLKISKYEAAVEIVVIYFRDTNSGESGEAEKYIVGYLDGHVIGDVEKKVLLEQLEKQRVFEKENAAAVGVVQ